MSFTFRSDLFAGDAALEACAVSDASHVTIGAVGDHVLRIQMALSTLDDATIAAAEIEAKRYGPSTAAAVLAFKTSRNIINPLYQAQPDNIVGKMTIARMDQELFEPTGTHDEMIDKAFDQSRRSLRSVASIVSKLESDIATVDVTPEPQKSVALAGLLEAHRRDILVISRRLLVSADPLSQEFRDALLKVKELIRDNLAQPRTTVDEGSVGRCDPAVPTNGGKVPLGSTSESGPHPRVSLCTPFFSKSRDLQRDVITHEYFHLLGLGDKHVTNTRDGLSNANTVAQVIALLNDRFRQQNSNGDEAAIPPFPSP